MNNKASFDIEEFHKIIGQELKLLRKEKAKMGVKEFADHVDMHRNSIANIENAKGDINISTLKKIVSFYGMTLGKFFKSLDL